MEWYESSFADDTPRNCMFCCGFYGSSHGQPVCSTCHLFLFSLEPELERSSATEDDQVCDDEQSLDSGNEEPNDPVDLVDLEETETNNDHQHRTSVHLQHSTNVAANNCTTVVTPLLPVRLTSADRNTTCARSVSGGGVERSEQVAPLVLTSVTRSSPYGTNTGLQHQNLNSFSTDSSGDAAPTVPPFLAAATGQEELNKRIRALSQYRPLKSLVSTSQHFHRSHSTKHETSTCSDSIKGAPTSSNNIHVNTTACRYPAELRNLCSCSGYQNGDVVMIPVVSKVPEEIFFSKIFPLLDDIQLFMCSRVCRRWQRMILSLSLPWERFVRNRWPLFSPQYYVSDWYEIYSRLVDSMCCHRCLWSIIPHQNQVADRNFDANWGNSNVWPYNGIGTSSAYNIGLNSVHRWPPNQVNEAMNGNVGVLNPTPLQVNRGWSAPVDTSVNYQNSHLTNQLRGLTSYWNSTLINNNQLQQLRDQNIPFGTQATRPVFSRPSFPSNVVVHSASTNLISTPVPFPPSRIVGDGDQNSWRNRRLMSEFQNLKCDPFVGIGAVRLDPGGYVWQATIEGPLGSPYEGGVFFLFMYIPENYPLKAPIVRFQTKILHPNVSLHGDIGIESIGGANWIPTLTLSKVLLSVLSLLTDPNCEISMNPEAARLFRSDKNRFNRLSKMFTYKYAMIDYINYKHQAYSPSP